MHTFTKGLGRFLLTIGLITPAFAFAAQPVVLGQTPLLGATDVPLEGPFTLRFDQALEPSSVNNRSIQLWQEGNRLETEVSLNIDGTIVEVYPVDSPIFSEDFYYFQVVGGFPGLSPAPVGLPNDYMRSNYVGFDDFGNGITMVGTTDTADPVIVSLSTDGDTLTTPGSEETVTITFSEDLSRRPMVVVDGEAELAHTCGDRDYKTACFTYAVGSGVEGPQSVVIEAAQDASAQSMLPEGRTIVVDTKPPTLAEVAAIPTGQDATPDYAFTSSEAGAIAYGGACSSASSAAVAGSNTITLATLATGTYSDCTIVVTDEVGNASLPLLLSAFTIVLPPTPPSVSVISRLTNDLSPVVSGSASDDTAVQSVTVLVQSVSYTADLHDGVWSVIIPEGTLGDGSYTVTATAVDTQGATAQAYGTLTIDRTAPVLNITGGPAEGSFTNNNFATFTFTADTPALCSLDNGAPVSCTGSFSTPELLGGTHSFTLEAADAAGNVTRAVRSWNVDRIAPVVTEVLGAPSSLDATPDYIFNTTKEGTITYGGACSSATMAAVAGDNTITFEALAPGTYSNCSIEVTDSVGNRSTPLVVNTFTILAPPPQEVTITLTATSDTYVHKGASDTNEGASPLLRIRAAGDNRALVRFNQAEIAAAVGSGTLLSAVLELTIDETKNNWGKQSRQIQAHRLVSPWAEGNGKNAGLPGNQSFRGTGLGATWECAQDTNIENHNSDCTEADDWDMRLKKKTPFSAPWVESFTDSVFVQKGQEGVIDFAVTADVQAYLQGSLNHGWVIRKEEENKPGDVSFFSKESAGAAPVLILTIRR